MSDLKRFNVSEYDSRISIEYCEDGECYDADEVDAVIEELRDKLSYKAQVIRRKNRELKELEQKLADAKHILGRCWIDLDDKELEDEIMDILKPPQEGK